MILAVAPIDDSFDKVLSHMDKITNEWTMQAARGECGWICSDCCVSFPRGMPDACEHGHQGCTDIITRDKKCAFEEVKNGTPRTHG